MKKFTKGLLATTLAIPSFAMMQGASIETVNASIKKEVTATSLNVRSGPGTNYKVVDWLQKGDVVTVLQDGATWDYVQFGNGSKGYVNDKHLKTTTVSNSDIYKVNTYRLTVRTGPGTNYSAKDYLKEGTTVTVISTSNNWAKVKYGSNNSTGYVSMKYLTKTGSSNSSSSSNVTTANIKVVTAHSLTLREGAGTNYKAIGYLSKGTRVNVLSTSGNWSKVSVNNKTGYVHSSYLENPSNNNNTSGSTGSTIQETYQTKYVTAPDGLNIRSGAGVNNKIVATMPYKAAVQVSTTVNNGWAKVKYGNVTGYVNVNYVSSTKPADNNTTPSVPSTPSVSNSLKGKTIVIDPGHGGKFVGAQGIVKEEVVNLQISLKVREELQAMGATVIMTRTDDTACSNSSYNADLACRPSMATKYNADAFISIHANSGGSSANGVETYYYNASRGDQKLATYIVKEIASDVGMTNRGAKYGNFAVLRKSTVPSTLVETGFVTNANDAAKLGDSKYQALFAKAIAEGIEEYF